MTIVDTILFLNHASFSQAK